VGPSRSGHVAVGVAWLLASAMPMRWRWRRQVLARLASHRRGRTNLMPGARHRSTRLVYEHDHVVHDHDCPIESPPGSICLQ
jgi:hypothetical protein